MFPFEAAALTENRLQARRCTYSTLYIIHLFVSLTLNSMSRCTSPAPTASTVRPSPSLTVSGYSNFTQSRRISHLHVIWLDAPESISHPVVISLVVAIMAPMLSSVK